MLAPKNAGKLGKVDVMLGGFFATFKPANHPQTVKTDRCGRDGCILCRGLRSLIENVWGRIRKIMCENDFVPDTAEERQQKFVNT